jgi:HlyD family secretion protein
MNLQTLRQSIIRLIRKKPAVSGLLGLGVLALIVVLFATSRKPTQVYSSYEVKRGDFLVSVVEGGTLQAVNELSIRNEVEGTARIIYIVPEGSYVKKGDLLVELDSSQAQDAVNQQQIKVEQAQFAVVQAGQQLDIQKSIADSDIQSATLKVEFAAADLKKYLDGEALQLRRNAQIAITNVMEAAQINVERLQWSERLYAQGFETKGNLDKDRLTVNQDKLRLEQAEQALWMVETFDVPKRKRELESALDEAKQNLGRVKLQSNRRLAQAEADLASQKRTLQLNEEKLERDKQQLLATKIYAPQGGLVVYGGSEGGGHFSNESMIEEGATVRNRQELIKLPDVSAMKLAVKIHESHINQVRSGEPAFVVLDSMPDQRFNGVVNKVAPLPDTQSRWSNPDLKVYATEILVTDKLPDVKPGVSARAEIIITNLPEVLTVPIQAVTTRKGKQVVFLASAPLQPVAVTVGQYNTKFIEISSGLEEGDRVLLAPPFDTQEKDLGGAIIADGDAMPAGATNQPSQPLGQDRTGNGRDRPGPPGYGNQAPPDAPAFAAVLASSTNGVSAAGDGSHLDEMRPGRRGRSGPGESGGNRTNRQERLKQFDTNGDGQLDENELAAMREQLRRERGRNTQSAQPSAD